MNTTRDETLEEIWAIRRQIAKKFTANPRKRVAYYQRKQKQQGAKIYQPSEPVGTDVQAFSVLRDEAHVEIATGQSATLASYRANRKRKVKRAK